MPRDNGYRKDSSAPKYLPNLPATKPPDEPQSSRLGVALSDPRWKRERKNFTQIHNDALRGEGRAAGVPYPVRFLYCLMLSYAWDTGYCFPSQETLAGHMECTTRTIRRYLVVMQKHKLVTVKRQGLGDPNIYHLEPTFD